jgi:hypothetical protein
MISQKILGMLARSYTKPFGTVILALFHLKAGMRHHLLT